ncbi:hypothetical protein EON65_34280 [archaeon]|nr:MAG: hypothetical protein EON65_34280 [archaeon]
MYVHVYMYMYMYIYEYGYVLIYVYIYIPYMLTILPVSRNWMKSNSLMALSSYNNKHIHR